MLAKAKVAAARAAANTKIAAQRTKLHAEAAAIEDKIKDKKHQFGARSWDMWIAGDRGKIDALFAEIKSEVDEFQRQYDAKQEELSKLEYVPPPAGSDAAAADPASAKAAKAPPAPPAKKPAQKTALATYDFPGTESDELGFKKGDVLTILDDSGKWWQAELNGKRWSIPANYVELQ